jgi:hypothetical protein
MEQAMVRQAAILIVPMVIIHFLQHFIRLSPDGVGFGVHASCILYFLPNLEAYDAAVYVCLSFPVFFRHGHAMESEQYKMIRNP